MENDIFLTREVRRAEFAVSVARAAFLEACATHIPEGVSVSGDAVPEIVRLTDDALSAATDSLHALYAKRGCYASRPPHPAVAELYNK